MEMERKTKNRLVNVLISQIGIMDNKSDLLASYKVESTKDLTDKDIDELIVRLRQMLEHKTQENDKQLRTWRSNILTLLNKMGIYVTNGDWSKVNQFLLNKKISGKLLYEMSVDEMKQLYRKLLMIHGKQQVQISKENILKVCN